jgi:hypothetical protein
VTIPANKEVRLVNQVGDDCEIQVGAATYTVSRGELVTIPSGY